eukprot:GCRY01001552.1.p1 GENE.GCRY01001552.1~~GCRY01001552.1.p1  ORF type:complete len:139 (+),score=22.47 GCRY01001552.1:132-548(+)
MSRSYYEILKLPAECSESDIKKAYHDLAKVHHPDKQSSYENNEEFSTISTAYHVLIDPEARKQYDAALKANQMRVPISFRVDLDDMGYDAAGHKFFYACRCGSRYEITEAELEEGVTVALCRMCSLGITVDYAVVEEC